MTLLIIMGALCPFVCLFALLSWRSAWERANTLRMQLLVTTTIICELIRGANSPMTFPLFKDVDKALRNVVTEINEIETYVSLRKGSK